MKKITFLGSALALAMGGIGLFAPHAYAVANTCTWTGAGGDSKFSTAANWTNCGSGVPQAGDIVTFDYIDTTPYTLINDLPVNTLLGGLTVDSAGAPGQYGQYTVDTLRFDDGAVLTYASGFSIGVSNTVTFAGSITFNNGMYMLHATTHDITVTPSSITVNNSPQACRGALPEFSLTIQPAGQVNVGAGSYYAIEGTESAVVVAPTGGVQLPAGQFGGNITFNGGGSVQGTTCFGANTYSMMNYNDTTLTGTITLAGGDVTYNVASGKTLTITGTINGAGSALRAYAGSAGTFVNNAASNNSTTSEGTQVVEMKTLPAITDDQPTVDLNIIANSTQSLDGTRKSVYVYEKGVLMGSGKIEEVLYVAADAIVSPGHSPGCLTSDTLSLYGTYSFELGGNAPCTGYDQLKVLNGASVPSAVTLTAANSILSTSRYNGYTPKQGDVFIIIDQASDKAVSGTFKDLPEGATFSQNGITFKISYVGGDGNDVTLTVMNQPTAPNTGFMIVKANPAVIAAVTVAAVIVLIGLAKAAKQR